jgi:NADH-quinone oxidoreductase subunit H
MDSTLSTMLLGWLLKFLFFPVIFVMTWATLLTLLERRQSAYAQDRIGPTRAYVWTHHGNPVTLGGLFHPVADALKMFFKETVIPAGAERTLFRIAPMIGFVASLVILALIPFGPDVEISGRRISLQIARIDSGVLYVLAAGSLGVYGVALAGWASNSRFALLGGLRAAAQAVSYEIVLGLTLVGVFVAYGSTELAQIVEAQSGLLYGFLPNWGLFAQPVGAALYLVAATAETKRIPFDLPEGESEIIGYFLEYSSMGFGIFMLGEFVEVTVFSALFVTLFLGGWHIPWILGEQSLSLGFLSFTLGPWGHAVAGTLVFLAKVMLVSMFHLQIRWTLPRFRYDQVMRLGWKQLLPLSLVNIVATAVLVWADPSLNLLRDVGVAILVIIGLAAIAGPRRASARAASHA